MKKCTSILAIIVTMAFPAIANAQEPCPAGTTIYSNGSGYEILPQPTITVSAGDVFYIYGIATEQDIKIASNLGYTIITTEKISISNTWSQGITIQDDQTITRFYFYPSNTPNPIMKQVCLLSASAPTAEPTATETATIEPTATETATAEPTATDAPTAEPTATETATAEPTATDAPTAEPTATPEPTQQEIALSNFLVSIVDVFQIIGGASSLITLGVLIWLASRLFKGFK